MESPHGAYLNRLRESRMTLQPAIEMLIAECDCLVVGSGFIDIITRRPACDAFIDGATRLGVAITCATLWCECTPENERRYGCPHGYGGPMYPGGFFAEMCERDPFDVAEAGVDMGLQDTDPDGFVAACNEFVREYVRVGISLRPEFSPCLVPGFWLSVPFDWRRNERDADAQHAE